MKEMGGARIAIEREQRPTPSSNSLSLAHGISAQRTRGRKSSVESVPHSAVIVRTRLVRVVSFSVCCGVIIYIIAYANITRVVNRRLKWDVAIPRRAHIAMGNFLELNIGFGDQNTGQVNENQWKKNCTRARERKMRKGQWTQSMTSSKASYCSVTLGADAYYNSCFSHRDYRSELVNTEHLSRCRWNDLSRRLRDQLLVQCDVYLSFCWVLVAHTRHTENRFSVPHRRIISMRCTSNGRKIPNPYTK